MTDAVKKYLTLEVDGEVAALFPIVSLPDGGRFDMIEAIIASNPVLRLVDSAEVGQQWDGSKYA